jgi:hypothetical protein
MCFAQCMRRVSRVHLLLELYVGFTAVMPAKASDVLLSSVEAMSTSTWGVT